MEACRLRQGPLRLPSRHPVGRKRACLSYISGPFRGRLTGMHSNELEVLEMASVLDEMGMDVDVMDYNSTWRGDPSRWDLMVGFGGLYEESCKIGFPGQHRVLYHTGAYLPFQNMSEMARVDDFQRRHGVRLRPRRVVDAYGPASHHLSDAIILVGNEWTASTYQSVIRPVSTINPTTNAYWRGPRLSPPASRRGILWSGGSGCLHKGLDLVLDAFASMPAGWDLHICGDNDAAEPDFWAYYHNLPKNVHRHGWLGPASSQMRTVLDACTFIVLPSCCEGMATSVLAGMACGLVPLVSRQSGIDVDGLGILIEGLDVPSVEVALHAATNLPAEQLMALTTACLQRVHERHELAVFRRRFAELIALHLPSVG